MDINRIKGLPPQQQVIITTGSQGEEMSALYRMAFSTHKPVSYTHLDVYKRQSIHRARVRQIMRNSFFMRCSSFSGAIAPFLLL